MSSRAKSIPADPYVIPELEEAMNNHKDQEWSDLEIGLLRKYYGKVPAPMLMKHLDGKTLNMIYGKAAALGLTKRKA